MDRSVIRSQLPALVAGHLPKNSRHFKYNVFDSQPMESTLGFRIDPKPFEGTVIANTDSAIILKTARTQFAVLDRSLANALPDDGTKVRVTPYARHHFDGARLDAPVEETERLSTGETFTVQRFILGGSTTRLPVPKPRCSQLADLIEQIERMPAPDGFRRVAHLLVDAGACDFSCVDPDYDDIIRTPPAIRFTVSSAKFAGQVTISYDRGRDVYTVDLHCDGARIDGHDEVYFEDLGIVLERLIDDGNWRLIKIDTLQANGARRHS